jgi:hypothetical protein
VVYPQRNLDESGQFQAEITGTCDVTLQGRVASDAPWVDIVTLSATGLKVVAIFPQLRVVTTWTDGEASAWVAE